MDTQMSKNRIVLPITGNFTAKDQAKSDKANKFIGRGSPASSTNAYRRAWGWNANCGVYHPDDVVFISAEGARNGRLTIDRNEILTAINHKVTFITDDVLHRTRSYNIGEREVAEMLTLHGYTEVEPGIWKFI